MFNLKIMESLVNKTNEIVETNDVENNQKKSVPRSSSDNQIERHQQQQLTPSSQLVSKLSPKSDDSNSNKISVITQNEQSCSLRSEQFSPIDKKNESDISNQSLKLPIMSEQNEEKQQLSSPHIETVLRQYRFKIPISDYYLMLEDAVIEEKSSKQYRYLTGDFMRIFEKHLEQFEKCKVQIQKRNNIVYDVPSRTSTVYIRINGDCKLCPRSNRVKFVFTIRKKPKGTEKFIDVDTKSRGNHIHNGVTIITTDISVPFTSNNTNFVSQEENNNMLVTTTTTTKSSFNNSNESSSISLNESTNSKLSMNEQLMRHQFMLNKNTNFNSSNNNQRVNIAKKRKNQNTIMNQNEISSNNPPFNEDNDDINLLNTSSASLSNFNEQLQTMITSTPPPPIPPSPAQLLQPHHFTSNLRYGSSSNPLQIPSLTTSSLVDRTIINQLSNQITSRIMIKLDQINLKVNQISDRLYELERKFENVDLPEFQNF